MLLSSLVRTGSWLQPGISSRLAMHLELDEQQGTSVAAQAAAASTTSSEDSSDEADLLASKNGSSAAAGSSSSSDPAAQPNFWIALRLLRGRIHAKVRVCSKTFRPIGVSYPLSGDVEVWKYKGWKLWTTELYFPEQQVHYANTGAFHRWVRLGTVRPAVTVATLFLGQAAARTWDAVHAAQCCPGRHQRPRPPKHLP
jgi:hypothetical protein